MPKFGAYRLFNSAANGCDKIGEVTFIGTKAFDSAGATHACGTTVTSADFADVALADLGSGNDAEYVIADTPYIETLSPRYGSGVGGTPVTFTGANFATDHTSYTILIDGIPCAIDSGSLTTTSFRCTTGARLGKYELDPELSIYIDGYGKGYVATQGLVYRYASLWSDPTTWGGLYAPIEGESVAINKGTNLLVDI